jgi:hypothetical protein
VIEFGNKRLEMRYNFKTELLWGLYLLDGITAGLFMIIFVLATLNSPLCSVAIISLTDFNSLATTLDVGGIPTIT